jgi:hypothetical protein
MTGKALWKSTALAAIAAGVVAAPLSAQAQEWGGRREGARGGNQSEGMQRGAPRETQQRPQAIPQQQAPVPQVRQQAQVQAQAQVAPQQQGWQGHGGWQQRGANPQIQAQIDARTQAQGQAGASRGRFQQPGQPVPQVAQQQGNPQWNDARRGQWNDAQRQAQAQSQAQNQQRQGWQGRNPAYADPNRNRGYNDPNRGNNGQWQRDGDRRQGYAGNWRGNDGRQNGGWNSGWRNDRRYDWQGYRNQNRQLFSAGRYYAPYRNYSYRSLDIGFFLDPGFFGSNYLIDDPYDYRLPPAYGPYRWVRYYDDVLLVNIYTGEVADVIRNFFY